MHDKELFVCPSGPDRTGLNSFCNFSASRLLWTESTLCLQNIPLMHNYFPVVCKVRPPCSHKLLWGRMRFCAFRKRKKGKRRVRSQCWTKCRICKDKILPLEIYPTCLCFLCTYLSEPASVGDNFTLTPTLPLWEAEADLSLDKMYQGKMYQSLVDVSQC